MELQILLFLFVVLSSHLFLHNARWRQTIKHNRVKKNLISTQFSTEQRRVRRYTTNSIFFSHKSQVVLDYSRSPSPTKDAFHPQQYIQRLGERARVCLEEINFSKNWVRPFFDRNNQQHSRVMDCFYVIERDGELLISSRLSFCWACLPVLSWLEDRRLRHKTWAWWWNFFLYVHTDLPRISTIARARPAPTSSLVFFNVYPRFFFKYIYTLCNQLFTQSYFHSDLSLERNVCLQPFFSSISVPIEILTSRRQAI